MVLAQGLLELTDQGPRRLPVRSACAIAGCGGGRTEAPATGRTPARAPRHRRAGHGGAVLGFQQALAAGDPHPTGEPGPKYWQQWADYTLQAELNPVSKRMTGQGHDQVPQPLARHAPHGLRPAAAEHLRAGRAPQHERALVGRGHRARPGRGAGADLTAAAAATAPGLRGEGTIMRVRSAHSRSRRAGRPTSPSTGSSGFRPTARPAGGQDGEVFFMNYWYPQMAVYDDINGWQIDQYLGQRRVLHGVRELRREPHRAGGLAGDRHRYAAESRPRCSRRRPAPGSTRPRPAARHRARGDRARPRAGQVHHGRHRRQAHLALPRRERARRRLGHLSALSVGRHHRRGRRRQRRRQARHLADPGVLAARAADQSLGRERPLRPALDRVLLQVSLALSLSSHDGGGRPELLRRHGVPDDDLHRRAVGHARHVRGDDPRDRAHVVPDDRGLGREALRLDGRGIHPVRPVAVHGRLLQGLRRRGAEPEELPRLLAVAAARSS